MNKTSKSLFTAVLIAVLGISTMVSVAVESPALVAKERLGKLIFFDTDLSLNGNQSCASCHGPGVGWVGDLSEVNAHGAVYEGSIPGAFGDRKPPS